MGQKPATVIIADAHLIDLPIVIELRTPLLLVQLKGVDISGLDPPAVGVPDIEVKAVPAVPLEVISSRIQLQLPQNGASAQNLQEDIVIRTGKEHVRRVDIHQDPGDVLVHQLSSGAFRASRFMLKINPPVPIPTFLRSASARQT